MAPKHPIACQRPVGVVYRHRAVKVLGLLRVGLQALIEPVQPIFNRIFAASVDAAWQFRRTVRAAFDSSQLCEALNPSDLAATVARGTSVSPSNSRPDRSGPPPSPVSAAASAYRIPSCPPDRAEAGASSRGATRNCGSSGTGSAADAIPLHACTTC